jgi:8-oxo-dGTP pyrophosphatase MutT (NUDIX family)
MGDLPTPTRDAATVLLLRDGPTGLEVFMVRRHTASGFMGGAHVFPGGKVDPSDVAVADRVIATDLDRTLAKLPRTPGRERAAEISLGLYVAAIRETHEEAGVLLARRADGKEIGPETWARVEAARKGTPSFAELIAAEDLVLDLDRLVPWAHWITPSRESRRFDTHFFLVRAPLDQTPSIDAHETTESEWLAPKIGLAKHDAGTIHLPPPTLVSLWELSRFSTVDEAMSDATRRPVTAVLPKLGAIGERIAIVMPWDSTYAAMEGDALPVADPHPMATPISRVVFDGERWIPGQG